MLVLLLVCFNTNLFKTLNATDREKRTELLTRHESLSTVGDVLPTAKRDRAHPLWTRTGSTNDEQPISAATQPEAALTWELHCVPDDDSVVHTARGQPGIMGRPRYVHHIWKTEGWR